MIRTRARWLRVTVLAAHLMLLPVCVGISSAGDGPVAEPSAATVSSTSNGAESTDTDPNNPDKKQNIIGKTADVTHDELERNILEQVIRLDSFFGNIKTETHQKAAYQLRWRNSLRVEQGGQVRFGTTLRANIELSRINERMNVVLLGEDEPEPFSSSLSEDPGNPGFDRRTQSLRVANTELRYGLVRTPSLDIFLGAGVRLIIPPEAFVRSRLQYTYKISDVSLLRFGETLFVKKLDVLGETSEFDLERLLDDKTLLRWANSGTLSDELKGMQWGTELSLIRELSPQSGITLTGGVYGNTSTDDAVQNFRILARYRRNFLRSWLFYELEPEVSWPRRADGSFPTSLAFTFRLEVMFQGKEK